MTADIRTHDGSDLDSYCNVIDMELSDLLRQIGTVNADDIPSQAQRKKFRMMRDMLRWANSFTGTLRYDVQMTHEVCEYHDERALDSVRRCLENLNAKYGS